MKVLLSVFMLIALLGCKGEGEAWYYDFLDATSIECYSGEKEILKQENIAGLEHHAYGWVIAVKGKSDIIVTGNCVIQ